MKLLFELKSAINSQDFTLCLITYARLLIPFFMMVLAWYFLIIIPQKIQQKRAELLAHKLAVGVWVTTSTGLIGRVIFIFNRSLVIELDSGEKVEVLKQVVVSVRNE